MFCDTCGANAPNKTYCMGCGTMRPTKTPESAPTESKIMLGSVVEFEYWGKTRRAKIKKVLRVNVEVQIVTSKRKRKTVRVPINKLRAAS